MITAECDCCGKTVPADQIVRVDYDDPTNTAGVDADACAACRGVPDDE